MTSFSQTLYSGVAVAALVVALGACSGSMDSAEPVLDAGQGDLMAGTIDPIERGKTYFASGHYGLALEAFSAAVVRDAASLSALNGVAATYDMLGRYDLADRYYDRALATAPQSVDLLNNLGYSYIMRGDAKTAEHYLAQAAALDVGNVQVQANLALVDQMNRAVAEAPAPTEVATAELTAAEVPSDTGAHLVRLAKGVQALVTTPRGDLTELTIAEWQPAEGDSFAADGGDEVYEDVVEVETAKVETDAFESAPVETAEAPATEMTADPVVIDNATAAVVEPIGALDQIEPIQPTVEVAEAAADPVAEVLSNEIEAAPADAAALSGPEPIETAALDTITPLAPGTARIEVSNGTGRTGMAYRMRDYLDKSGVKVARVTNAETYDHARSHIAARPEAVAEAKKLAAQFPVNLPITVDPAMWPEIRLVIGRDLHEFDDSISHQLVAELLVF